MISKISKPLDRPSKKREREKTQIINIRNERGDITTDIMEIKRIIKKYYKQFYTHKFDNLDETDQFLERHNVLKLTQEKQTI